MPAVQKEILLQFFLGSPISVLDSLDYLYRFLRYLTFYGKYRIS